MRNSKVDSLMMDLKINNAIANDHIRSAILTARKLRALNELINALNRGSEL